MSMARIDLRTLAARESGQIEWKENVADERDVVETITAFANDFSNLGGGYVVCGARETKDEAGFPRVEFVGLEADRFKRVRGRVLDLCRDCVDPPYVPEVEEVQIDGAERRVLVFVVPRSPHAHTFRRTTDSGKFYIRQGDRTIEARNGLMRELLATKGGTEDWDLKPAAGASVDDLDLVAVRDTFERLRIRGSGRDIEETLLARHHPLAPELCVRVPLRQEIRPRRFALLLFGRDIQRFFPGAYTVFAQYAGSDRADSLAERHNLDGNLLRQAERLLELLNAEAYTVMDKRPGAERANMLKYPVSALREAAVNALAHRDYLMSDPTRVTVFEDRVEIWSPGNLLRGVDPDEFRRGQAKPRWRNRALTWYFERLNLAQGLGQGISTILRSMRTEGCPDPSFALGVDSVEAVLPAHPRHALLRTLMAIQRDLVYGRAEDALRAVEPLLEADPFDFRLLELFCDAAYAAGELGRVKAFAVAHQEILDQLPASAQVLLAEGLARLDDDARALARNLFHAAAQAHLDEDRLRKLLIGVIELGDGELALSAIDRAMGRVPAYAKHPVMRQLRARAEATLGWSIMKGLARLPASRRSAAREEIHRLIADARRDLGHAGEGPVDSYLQSAIERTAADIDALDRRVSRLRSAHS